MTELEELIRDIREENKGEPMSIQTGNLILRQVYPSLVETLHPEDGVQPAQEQTERQYTSLFYGIKTMRQYSTLAPVPA